MVFCWPWDHVVRNKGRMDIVFPEKLYGGYIFDCDGTLVDTMPLHYQAWVEVLAEAGHPGVFSEDLFYSLGGMPTDRIVETLNGKWGLSLDPVEILERKEAAYRRAIPQVQTIPAVADFAHRMARIRPVAVASGGLQHLVREVLEAVGLLEVFPIRITPEQVARGKPAPDMFLLAAEKMGVPPAQCLVLEDAELGRQAAHAAGMDCLMIPNGR